MKLGYKYYRKNLIKLAILSVAFIPVFWAHLHGTGNPKDEPGALILIAVMMVVGNVGLFIAMRRAKCREQAEALQTRIAAPRGR
jgi:hypothetical protein